MGKRSPILGYNHNVLYRGLVFHVQTEDSGVASPHLFTHLFHDGVIVSTRKLVYDAGSAEEAIKSLMQAQHKATLKDLRRGHFDDKIDSYLGGTPGLLPRGTEEAAEAPERPGENELAPSQGIVEELALGIPTQQVEPMFDDSGVSERTVIQKTPPVHAPATAAAPIAAAAPAASVTPATPAAPRTSTERPSAPVVARAVPATARTAPVATRKTPAPRDTTLKTEAPFFDASSEIEIELPLNLEDSGDTIAIPRRLVRDTETQAPFNDHTRPTLEVKLDDHSKPTVGRLEERIRRAASVSDGLPGAVRTSSPTHSPSPPSDPRRPGERPSSATIPPAPPAPPAPVDTRRLGDRPSTINAATLPPARPISRPPTRPALGAALVASRPMTSEDRGQREPEPAEAYPPAVSPAPEQPPGERSSQYAQHKKPNPRLPIEGGKGERGGVPVPSGLGRPQRMGAPSTAARPGPTPPSSTPTPAPIPREPLPQHASQTEPVQARTPTPTRISPPGAVGNRFGAASNSGVVMTRPAVIVGAPAKSVGTVPRIRKAREDEGRGFGQGLISEKSLDEVILAYLSEDADEK